MQQVRERLHAEVSKVVVGQPTVIDMLLVAVSVGGHALLEGVPGTAKTLTANAVARALGLDFNRVSFTPDMLPSDLTGTMTLRNGNLEFRQGPVHTHVLLADEINRTPPKTQSAVCKRPSDMKLRSICICLSCCQKMAKSWVSGSKPTRSNTRTRLTRLGKPCVFWVKIHLLAFPWITCGYGPGSTGTTNLYLSTKQYCPKTPGCRYNLHSLLESDRHELKLLGFRTAYC